VEVRVCTGRREVFEEGVLRCERPPGYHLYALADLVLDMDGCDAGGRFAQRSDLVLEALVR
jgi:hypothetical protein